VLDVDHDLTHHLQHAVRPLEARPGKEDARFRAHGVELFMEPCRANRKPSTERGGPERRRRLLSTTRSAASPSLR
jgi:hypothetical protein